MVDVIVMLVWCSGVWRVTLSETSELLSRSVGNGNQVLRSISYLLGKGFWQTMFANWHARHGNPICSHDSELLHPGHFVTCVIFLCGMRYWHEVQKDLAPHTDIVLSFSHLHMNVDFLQARLFSVLVIGGSIKFEDVVLWINIPKVLARYLAAPCMRSSRDLLLKVGKHGRAFQNACTLISVFR